jgi:hypothetical protein
MTLPQFQRYVRAAAEAVDFERHRYFPPDRISAVRSDDDRRLDGRMAHGSGYSLYWRDGAPALQVAADEPVVTGMAAVFAFERLLNVEAFDALGLDILLEQ